MDHRRGISQFTVGTGGYFLFPIRDPRKPHSQFVYNESFGAMFMRLGFKRYGWSFVNVFGQTVDGGKRRCTRAKRRPHRHRRHRHNHHGGGQSNAAQAAGHERAHATRRRAS